MKEKIMNYKGMILGILFLSYSHFLHAALSGATHVFKNECTQSIFVGIVEGHGKMKFHDISNNKQWEIHEIAPGQTISFHGINHDSFVFALQSKDLESDKNFRTSSEPRIDVGNTGEWIKPANYTITLDGTTIHLNRKKTL